MDPHNSNFREVGADMKGWPPKPSPKCLFWACYERVTKCDAALRHFVGPALCRGLSACPPCIHSFDPHPAYTVVSLDGPDEEVEPEKDVMANRLMGSGFKPKCDCHVWGWSGQVSCSGGQMESWYELGDQGGMTGR